MAHLSHLAIHPDYQGQGLGKKLIEKVKADLGEGVTLMVHAATGMDDFYKKLGFSFYENMYRIKRRG